MKKYLIFIIIVLVLFLTISGSITTNIVQRLRYIKLQNKYTNLLQDKNKIKQSEEKYLKEVEIRETIIYNLNNKLKEIEIISNKEVKDNEKIKYYRSIISDSD